MEKGEKLGVVSTIIVIGFFISVLAAYFKGAVLGMGFPHDTFLQNSNIVFNDYTILMNRIRELAPYVKPNEWMNYLPLAYLILWPFSLIRPEILSYGIFTAIFIPIYTIINMRFLKCENISRTQNILNIFVICFLSYPFLFMVTRGNTDLLIFPLFALFVWLYYRDFEGETTKEGFSKSAVILGMLCAMKPYFVIFMFLYLKKKSVKNFVLSCVATPVFILLAFLVFKIFGGGEYLTIVQNCIKNITDVKYTYLWRDQCTGLSFSSSVLSLIKGAFYGILKKQHYISIYYIAVDFATVALIWGLCKEKIFWKQLALISFYIYSIPFMVYDYKLVFMLVPLWYFLNSKEKGRFDLIYTVIFALFFINKNYFAFRTLDPCCYVGPNMLNPILMFVFMGLIIYEQKKLEA